MKRSLATVARIVVAAIAFWPAFASADWEGTPLAPHAALPAPFSFATASDALAATYPTYAPATGTVRALRGRDGRPDHVSVLEAGPWSEGDAHYLVAAIGRQRPEAVPHPFLCGVCLRRFSIALLTSVNGKLRLVARTHEDGPLEAASAMDAWLDVTGDGIASLDLAPYRLSEREMLIGVRDTWSVPQAYGTRLWLFRVVGRDLRVIANIPVEEGSASAGDFMREVASVVVARGQSAYNDLRATTRSFKVTSSDYGYSSAPGPHAKQIGPATCRLFRFDGSHYAPIARVNPCDRRSNV